ncbi:MAG: nitronate monooxygenase, partial [Thermoanaerobaculales bacterium]|nr:nitronate monooxygenase [Thermoanaerobaculales bacterium]
MAGRLRVMVSTPRGQNDPALAIAGSRAGAVGILDLGALADLDGARHALTELLRLGRTAVGLRVEANGDASAIAELVAALPPGAGWLVLAPGIGGAFAAAPQAAIASARERGLNVLAEVSSRQDAEAALELGVQGLVAKGSEAGGRVDEETTFVLLQELLQHVDLPVWARGGIGTHTAAACAAAGAAGVVLGDELVLLRESSLAPELRQAVAGMDGSETSVVGAELGRSFRFIARSGCAGSETLKRRYTELLAVRDREGWLAFLDRTAATADGPIGWGSHQAWPLGQDASFAAPLAARFRTVGGAVAGILAAVEDHLRIACSDLVLAPGSPLATAHATRYPIVQGPMTRVSDVAPFALEVAKAGALPFIALALMRSAEVRTLLAETQRSLGDRPWGVGILGFVPRELREEQLAVVREVRPRFVLIAGGRPDQAAALESEGIASYLHVPSPRLLDLFIDQGARRFVFEGRECGGHVGPRSSFVLWQQMVDVLCARTNGRALDDLHVLFAGGIHDARSAAMVAALAAPLAASGAKVGVLMGTAYLFTAEAVSSSAIVPGFQEVAVGCTRTTVLETGPGHSTRCAPTPFAEAFTAEKSRLLEEGRSGDEIRLALEAMNLGKLRVAAKGLDRNPGHEVDAAAPRLQIVDPAQQAKEGMYMIGQVAALRDRVTTMAELHEAVSEGSVQWLSAVQRVEAAAEEPPGPPLEIALVGMACLLPGATDLATFWDNVLAGTDVTTEVPRERWDWQRYFDEDRAARDKVYSRWGGFLPEIPFDPLAYGMPPSTLRSIEPLQLLTLEVVRAALADAGLLDREFPRQRASVILGAGGGVADLGNRYAVRATLPSILDNLPDAVWEKLPEWTEDSFAGLLLNVAAGRAANRFDLGGINLTVDAACASSLAAVYLAAQELAERRSDVVLAGGVDTAQNPFGYLCFSKTHALSPRGKASVFDASADGIVISEGLAVIVLKRLADAERDGDRVYAVLRGVGGSSDGRGRSMTAPRPEGQVRALDRAYRQAAYSPATVELFEAHGTGTAAGDVAEAETLRRVLEAAGAPPASAAVGSVKSMIGHTKCTAGVTGVIKSALALHRKVLPPTINVERPNPKAGFGDGPLYVNSELRPWLAGSAGHPRRAGVSAFGFGGTNFHVTLEEYTGDPRSLPQPALA